MCSPCFEYCQNIRIREHLSVFLVLLRLTICFTAKERRVSAMEIFDQLRYFKFALRDISL